MVDRITLLLKTKNITASQFADEVGVQRSSVSHVLSGRNKPSLDFIQKILKKYPEINPDWLLFGKGAMNMEFNLFSEIGDSIPLQEEVIDKALKRQERPMRAVPDNIVNEILQDEVDDEIPAGTSIPESDKQLVNSQIASYNAEIQTVSAQFEPDRSIPQQQYPQQSQVIPPLAYQQPQQPDPAPQQVYQPQPAPVPAQQVYQLPPQPNPAPQQVYQPPLQPIPTQQVYQQPQQPIPAPQQVYQPQPQPTVAQQVYQQPLQQNTVPQQIYQQPLTETPSNDLSGLNTQNQIAGDQKVRANQESMPIIPPVGKEIEQIMVFYKDKTFTVYKPE